MKIDIPESMHREMNRITITHSQVRLSFKDYTHHIARAILEEELEE